MSPSGVGYHFLPWVRFGLLSNASTPDPFDASLAPRLSQPMTLRVIHASGNDDVPVPLTMYGPGDVIGIDPREIVRTEPRHLTPDFPPHLFASIEFDHPEFPWLFTPASPSPGTRTTRLRPWIVLAVVRKAVATITTAPDRPLPVLTCPASELPDLQESWLWAHAAYVGALDGGSVTDRLADKPQQSISRLLCPRQLEASQGGSDAGYYACLVPAFEVGRRAGLGDAPAPEDATSLRPAWTLGGSASVTLPVYYHWEFKTGPYGDFKDAVARLQLPNNVPTVVGALIDAREPGGGVSRHDDMFLRVGALRPLNEAPPTLPASFGAFRDELRTILQTPPASSRRVAPPIYGRAQATGPGVQGPTPLAPGAAPPWLADLNLDPRRRVAAALGAQLVQEQQERLVASAWQQAGEARAVNQWLRQKQLGREVTRSVAKRLAQLAPEALHGITAPVATGATVPAAAASTSAAPEKATQSPAFRRLARPFGVLAPPGTPPAPSLTAPVRTVVSNDPLLAKLNPDATFALEARARLQAPGTLMSGGGAAPASISITPSFPQPMYEALRERFGELLLPGVDGIPDNCVLPFGVDAGFVEAFMAGLNDEMSRELLWREFPGNLRGTYFRQFWDVSGQLAADAPESERERLRDIPPITTWTSALGSNMPASRSQGLIFLLFKGDLLTRFPTASIYAARGTWASDGSGVQIVDAEKPAVLPQMRLHPVPGVTLLGFNLIDENGVPATTATVAGDLAPPGDAGWFFILEEHPTDSRFGLDITSSPLTTWRSLAWPDVLLRGDGSRYIAAAARVPILVAPPQGAPDAEHSRYQREQNIAWASDSAAMAYITLQQPFRQEVHAGYWFPRAS